MIKLEFKKVEENKMRKMYRRFLSNHLYLRDWNWKGIFALVIIIASIAWSGNQDFKAEAEAGHIEDLVPIKGTWEITSTQYLLHTDYDTTLDMTEFDPPEFSNGEKVIVVWDSINHKPYSMDNIK